MPAAPAHDAPVTDDTRPRDVSGVAVDDEHPLLVVRLRWLIGLRWLFILVAVAVLAVERAVELPTAQPRPAALWGVFVALAGVNVAWTLLAKRIVRAGAARCPPWATWVPDGQVAVDLLFLTVILRYAGSIQSPLTIFYVFHMAIGALLLPARRALLEGLWACGLCCALAVADLRGWLVPRYPFDLYDPRPDLAHEPSNVAATVAVVMCGIFGTLYFTLHIAGWLRAREWQLSESNAALHRSQRAVIDLQARRSRFMQTAAHQLKGPLAAIQTLAGLVRDDLAPGSNSAAMCDRITRRCREGIHQVDELLTLARVQDAEPSRHHLAESDVSETVVRVCLDYKPAAHAGRVSLVLHPTPTEARVRVNDQDLRDCVANVVENAIKYTPPGGHVDVRVGTHDAESGAGDGRRWYAVTVCDSGMGLEQADLDARLSNRGSLFDAFRRGNNALAAGITGSGLGLTIVREVVEKCGGRMEIQSQPGRGTTFTLILPGVTRAGIAPVQFHTASGGGRAGDIALKGEPPCSMAL